MFEFSITNLNFHADIRISYSKSQLPRGSFNLLEHRSKRRTIARFGTNSLRRFRCDDFHCGNILSEFLRQTVSRQQIRWRIVRDPYLAGGVLPNQGFQWKIE